MKAMKSTTELDSSQVLLSLSAKVPSYSGVKWCRFAHEEQMKRECPIRFKDFVQFVKLEAELANDPILSPDALKKERRTARSKRKAKVPELRRQHGSVFRFICNTNEIEANQPDYISFHPAATLFDLHGLTPSR